MLEKRTEPNRNETKIVGGRYCGRMGISCVTYVLGVSGITFSILFGEFFSCHSLCIFFERVAFWTAVLLSFNGMRP